jgi:protein involved in polysaccharide export with SLBB domain
MRAVNVSRILLTILFLTFVATQLGIQTAAQISEPAKPSSGTGSRKLVISGGDLLHISVMGAPEFDQDLRVSDSGQITLPFAGSVNLTGLSTAEA